MNTLIEGAKGGGKGGGGSSRTPREEPNTLRSTSTARILDLLCEGPIVGLANGNQSIYFDDTPLEDGNGNANFSGVTIHTRDGYPDQAYVEGFPAVESETDVSAQVKRDTPITRTIDNLDADAVRVKLQLPALSEQKTDTGDLVGYSVQVAIDVRANGGSWSEQVNDVVSGKTTSPYQRQYRIPLRGNGPWDVRMRRISEDNDKAVIQNETYFAAFTTIIDSKLTYPDSALVGVTVDAQQFGSNIPSRAYDVKLRIIEVPSNYDPETRTYSGLWDGTFKLAWTDNPAWCFRDLAMNTRYGAGLESVDKWGLYQIAQYCDELVPNGYGANEPRYTFNAFFTSRQQAITTLDTLASIFRGMTYWGADTVMAAADMPADPVKLVSPSNVIDDAESGCFVYQGTALRDRHTVALVSWNDPDNNDELSVEVVEDRDGIEQYGYRQTDITLVGCKSRGQARRAGLWLLYSERAETETVSYTCSVDHADVRPGDLIQLNDPTTAGARLSGRIRGTGTDSLVLDALPDEASGSSWVIDVKLPNGSIERREVAGFTHSEQRANLALPLSAQPVEGAIWMLSSSDVEPRLFRVLSNREQADHTYAIEAVEHDPNKYARIEQGLDLPEPDNTLIPTGPIASPYNITLQASTYLAGGTEHQKITVSWTPSDDPRVMSYIVDAQGPSDVKFATVFNGEGTSFDIMDADPGEWMVRVRGVTGIGNFSPWVSITTQVTALLQPLPPTAIDIEEATFSIRLRPSGGRPTQQYQFWRAEAALEESQIESNAVNLGVADVITDTGLRSGTQYFYYVRGINVYGVSSWYPVQATTRSDFSDIFNAIESDIQQEGQLYPVIVDGLKPAAVEAAESAVAPFRAELDENTENIGELQAFSDETAIKMLLLKAGGEASASTLRVEQTVRANIARQVTTLQTGQAKVEDDLYTIYDPETDGFTAAAIRTVDVNGTKAVLGMRSNGEVAEIGAIADRFYIYNEVSGEMVLAFVVEDGRVVMPEALIGKVNVQKLVTDTGETLIEGGKIKTKFIDVDAIKANEIVSKIMGYNGRPTFAFRENGTFEMNSQSSDGGGISWINSALSVRDENGAIRVKIGRL